MELESVGVVHTKKIPWGSVPVVPVGDLQIQPNRELFDEKRFRRMLEWGIANDAYYLGMGDYVDFASPSNRAAIKGLVASGGLYDSAIDSIEAAAEEHLDWVKELLEPTRGRWLGLLEGHHFMEFSDGTTSDMRLANFLGCRFLGTSAYVNVEFETEAQHKKNPSIRIWCHHGRSAGKPLAAPLNQLEQVVKGFDADVYVLGHHHKSVAGKMSRIYPVFTKSGKNRLEHREMIIACTGSFLKGWAENQSRAGRPTSTYAEKGMMNPLALGHIVIWARPRLSGNETKIDLTVEV